MFKSWFLCDCCHHHHHHHGFMNEDLESLSMLSSTAACSWLTRPMWERQGCEQCLQEDVMSGVVVGVEQAFLLLSPLE